VRATHITVSMAIILALGAGTARAQDVWVPDYSDGTVSVVDPATNSVSTVDLSGYSPEGVAFSMLGDTAVVSLDVSDQVAIVDTGTHGATFATVTPRFDPDVFRQPGMDRFFVTSWAGAPNFDCKTEAEYISQGNTSAEWEAHRSISVIEGGVEVMTIPVLSGVWQMAFSPDGSYAWALACDPDNGEWGWVVRIDVAGAAPTYTQSAPIPLSTSTAVEIAVSPTDPVALVTDGPCVLVVDLDLLPAPAEVNSLCGFSSTWGLQYSPDGTRAFVIEPSLITLDTDTDPLAPTIAATTPVSVVNPAAVPQTLEVAGTSAYVIAVNTPSEVTVFDMTDPDAPVQGCSAAVGNDGLLLGIRGVPPEWLCAGAGGARSVKGTGHLTSSPRVHFEFHARVHKGGFKGQCNVQDRSSKPHRHIRCLDVTSLLVSGDTAVITGNALDGKTRTTYTIQVTEGGKPKKGGTDTFTIWTGTLYMKGPDTLKNGDIKFKP